MPAGLTQRQHDALRFIERTIEESGGISPSYDEIRIALGYASKSSVHRLIRELADRGHIVAEKRRYGCARSISLPTVYGASCPHCGMPLRSQQCAEMPAAQHRFAKEDRGAGALTQAFNAWQRRKAVTE